MRILKPFLILLLVGWAATLFSCSTFGKAIDNPGSISDAKSSYIVFKVIDKRHGFLTMKPENAYFSFSKAFTDNSTFSQATDEGFSVNPVEGSPYVVVHCLPGTYRLSGFFIEKTGLLGSGYLIYVMDPQFYAYFKLNPGEIAYVGTFTLEEKGDKASSDFNFQAVKDEVTTKYPKLSGLHWVSSLESRQSF